MQFAGLLDIPRHHCRVYFDLELIDARGRVERWQEEYIVRYIFAQELELTLRQNRLELFNLRSFPDDEAPADERAWT